LIPSQGFMVETSRRVSESRRDAASTSRIQPVTVAPTATASSLMATPGGSWETWTRPSTPGSTSTKRPKSAWRATVPVKVAPAARPRGDPVPRVLLQLLHREGDPLPFLLDLGDLDRHLLADLEDVLGVGDPAAGDLGHVDQSVDPAEVHEGPEIGDRPDAAGEGRADLDQLAGLLGGLVVLLAHEGRAETTTRRPSSVYSMIRKSKVCPTKAARAASSCRPTSIWETGQNARGPPAPPMATSNPPLLRETTFPSTGIFAAQAARSSALALRPDASFLEIRISGPALTTTASIRSPTLALRARGYP